jgi:hypothetical protein
VLSLRTQNNGVCREYRIAGATSGPDFAGLACRTVDGTWRVAIHVETPKQTGTTTSGSYQTATAGNVPAVDALVETLIAGDAFGSDEESKLLKNGWHVSSTGAP